MYKIIKRKNMIKNKQYTKVNITTEQPNRGCGEEIVLRKRLSRVDYLDLVQDLREVIRKYE